MRILALPRRAEVIALGGIDAARLPVCRALGFDGVAVLGSVWQAADPLKAFSELQTLAGRTRSHSSLAGFFS
jgi:thiamine-phosphate pyrophosphorylase